MKRRKVFFSYGKTKTYPSEMSADGKVKWQKYSRTHSSHVQIIPNMYDYARTVYTLGSGIFEWQGWAVSDFIANDDVELSVRCLNAHTFHIDDVRMRSFTGDVYWREQYATSVRVSRGIHTIYVPLRATMKHAFNCQISQRAQAASLLLNNPHFTPQIWSGRLVSGFLALPVTNLLTSKWIRVVDVSSSDDRFDVRVLDKNIKIAPGQTLAVRVELMTDEFFGESCSEVPVELLLTSSEGSQALSMALQCRKMAQSFLFTFIDHDASVQVAAAIKPRRTCSEHLCAVLLTLHGTGVDKQTQADSHKHMVDGQFVFGADRAWVLAPTRLDCASSR